VEDVAGLLLTGGASRRMGSDKARLLVGGRTLAQRAAEALAAVCHPVLEVGPGHSGLSAVREDPPGSGPLAALGAGWTALKAAGHRGPVLVLAVDMPFVGQDLLRFLAHRPGRPTAVPRHEGRAQPLCARFGVEALEKVDGLLAAGDRSMRALLEVAEVSWVDRQEWEPLGGPDAFTDLDEPADLDRLERQ
jgi:molybdopterin-guanine dinucleotide biosynthesis protein A